MKQRRQTIAQIGLTETLPACPVAQPSVNAMVQNKRLSVHCENSTDKLVASIKPSVHSAPGPHNKNVLSDVERKTLHHLMLLGVDDEIIRRHLNKDSSSHIVGTYRIVLSKVLRDLDKPVPVLFAKQDSNKPEHNRTPAELNNAKNVARRNSNTNSTNAFDRFWTYYNRNGSNTQAKSGLANKHSADKNEKVLQKGLSKKKSQDKMLLDQTELSASNSCKSDKPNENVQVGEVTSSSTQANNSRCTSPLKSDSHSTGSKRSSVCKESSVAQSDHSSHGKSKQRLSTTSSIGRTPTPPTGDGSLQKLTSLHAIGKIKQFVKDKSPLCNQVDVATNNHEPNKASQCPTEKRTNVLESHSSSTRSTDGPSERPSTVYDTTVVHMIPSTAASSHCTPWSIFSSAAVGQRQKGKLKRSQTSPNVYNNYKQEQKATFKRDSCTLTNKHSQSSNLIKDSPGSRCAIM